jgi:hypothetical protein
MTLQDPALAAAVEAGLVDTAAMVAEVMAGAEHGAITEDTTHTVEVSDGLQAPRTDTAATYKIIIFYKLFLLISFY